MVRVKAQGTLVLPFQRINDLLNTVETENNKFHQARDSVIESTGQAVSGSKVESIDFEVTGNRVHVTCETSGDGLKDTFKHTFDLVYAVISELMTLSLKAKDIENEDTLMSVKDIEIISTED